MIKREGIVLPGGILKVDAFLNQRVDASLMMEIGKAFAAQLRVTSPDIILTIESSGIAPAVMTALALNAPLVIAKKQTSRITTGEQLSTLVHSFTKDTTYELFVSKAHIPDGSRVLFIDDFLAAGEAAFGAARLVESAKAKLTGIGIVIEKSFQEGRAKLEALRIPIVSLARIASMDHTASDPESAITFMSDT
jgi:xanthine phosphoribosyltransferase